MAHRQLAPVVDANGTAEQQERCELCGEPLPAEHRHLLDLESRRLLCACRACSMLLHRRAAGGGHYRLIPDRRLRLDDFELDEVAWEQLRIPVEMAFFFFSSAAKRVVAFYPSPMGATESRLELTAWEQLQRANPALGTIEHDVEALLVNRARGRRGEWIVPVDDCYRLVAVIRTRWRGFTGGKEVWTEIERFFEELDRRARPHRQREPEPDLQPAKKELRWRTSTWAPRT
jgi:hypothetical protein